MLQGRPQRAIAGTIPAVLVRSAFQIVHEEHPTIDRPSSQPPVDTYAPAIQRTFSRTAFSKPANHKHTMIGWKEEWGKCEVSPSAQCSITWCRQKWLTPSTRQTHGFHPWRYIPLSPSNDPYKFWYLPSTMIPVWNNLPPHVVSSPTLESSHHVNHKVFSTSPIIFTAPFYVHSSRLHQSLKRTTI